ncbi:IclR family transcriptional regulator C-terminal domain-containing protein [Pandoraea pnomenusa]|uniref:IclR family transcriptional regulator domain-containing protein n=1 Tax=Pandoraea pnomenusa TaxID=93220 RepID=UPI00333F6106
MYIEWVRSSEPITVMRSIGVRLPIATTSMGRAYLVAASEDERRSVLDQVRMQDEDEWPSVERGIEQAKIDYQERGFCLSVGDWDRGISSVGVPFTAPDGTQMAFNCGGPAFILSRDALEHDIGPRLVELARRISVATGRA